MENSYRLNTSVHKQRSLDKHKSCKFKHISNPISTSHTLVNELNYKYDIYKHGTPNLYENDIAKIKAANFINNINIVDTPQLDDFLNTLTSFKENPGINKRDYNVHPLPKHQKNRFKDLVSDKREISDFIVWIEQRLKQIQCKGQSAAKKFHEKQNIIATGFNQTIIQLSKLSKPRAQLLKTLWNKQNQELSLIIRTITNQKLKEQKKYLQNCKDLHSEYQNQIKNLTKQIEDYKLKYQRQLLVNKSIVNTLRVQRRRLKRYELLIKKMNDFNFLLKNQNLGLIQENNKLILNSKNISEEQAKVLTYRIIQLQKQKQKCFKSKLNFKELKEHIHINSKKAAKNQPLIELQQKKQKLYRFLVQRMSRFPNEKLFVRQSYFSDQEDGPASIQQYLKSLISSKEIQQQLIAQAAGFNLSYADKAVGTHDVAVTKLINQDLQFKILTINKQIQTEQFQSSTITQNCLKSIQNTFYCFEHDQFTQIQRKKARQRRTQLSNYLILLGMQNTGKISKNCLKDSKETNFKQSIITPSIFQSVVQDEEEEQVQQNIYDKLKQVLMKFISTNKKTKQFQKRIQELREDAELLYSQRTNISNSEKFSILELDKEDQKILKVRDLIMKYTQTHKQPLTSINIQKFLNKTLVEVYKKLYKNPQKNPFVVELFEYVKDTDKQNISNEFKKLLMMISAIYQNQQNSTEYIKTLALLLGIGQKHTFYENINQQDVSHFYFKLFNILTIKSPLAQQFHLWKNYTTSAKLKNSDFHEIIANYVHEKRHMYIINSLQEFALIKPQILTTSQSQSAFIPLQSVYSIDLHKILLFIIQVYLLEKKNYYESYNLLFYILQSHRSLRIQIFILILDLVGCAQSLQLQIINHCFKPTKKVLSPIYCKTDHFYRMCVKHNFPYFEQINLILHQKFREVPESFINEFFSDFSRKNWLNFRQSLDQQCTNKMPKVVFRAIEYIVGILQKNSYAVGKQKQQILAFLYKLLIVKLYGMQNASE